MCDYASAAKKKSSALRIENVSIAHEGACFLSRSSLIDAIVEEFRDYYCGWRGPGTALPEEKVRRLACSIWHRVLANQKQNDALM